jgi:hypothetical protein
MKPQAPSTSSIELNRLQQIICIKGDSTPAFLSQLILLKRIIEEVHFWELVLGINALSIKQPFWVKVVKFSLMIEHSVVFSKTYILLTSICTVLMASRWPKRVATIDDNNVIYLM